jgi:hypothetical protein
MAANQTTSTFSATAPWTEGANQIAEAVMQFIQLKNMSEDRKRKLAMGGDPHDQIAFEQLADLKRKRATQEDLQRGLSSVPNTVGQPTTVPDWGPAQGAEGLQAAASQMQTENPKAYAENFKPVTQNDYYSNIANEFIKRGLDVPPHLAPFIKATGSAAGDPKVTGGPAEFEHVNPQWKGKNSDPAYAKAYVAWKQQLGEAGGEKYNLIMKGKLNTYQDPDDPSQTITLNPMQKEQMESIRGIKLQEAKFSSPIKQRLAEAAQRGGATTANINDAYRTYGDLSEKMKEMRHQVTNNNIFPSGGFKKIESLDQWIQEQSSNPEIADMLTSIGMMSESLSRALGSTQGGQFMLEYANKLLDPHYSDAAFDRVVDRHLETLHTKYKARRGFGLKRDDTPPSEPKVPTPDAYKRPGGNVINPFDR